MAAVLQPLETRWTTERLEFSFPGLIVIYSFLGFNLQDESLFMTSLLLVNGQAKEPFQPPDSLCLAVISGTTVKRLSIRCSEVKEKDSWEPREQGYGFSSSRLPKDHTPRRRRSSSLERLLVTPGERKERIMPGDQ